jgi:carbon monoxide dehydrogenase subunit G
MEHEVFVPVPVERLRAVLSDPERVARAVPGLQQDAGAAPVAGRLKVRVAGHTITYRGALRVLCHDDGSYAIEGDATEARGSGSVQLALSVRLLPAEGGTEVAFGGTATADGRIAELPSDAVSSTTARLLNRFAENLGKVSGEAQPDPESDPEPDPESDPESGSAAGAGPEPASQGEPGAGADAEPGPGAEAEAGRGPESAASSVFEREVPPPSSDPYAEDDLGSEDVVASGGFADEGEPPTEAAHARRTMIGRSAEEVDHAPPRGRYAPVPAPESVVTGPALRWAAPAAALAVASAVLVARALRKRR